jgi:hypothetical protein
VRALRAGHDANGRPKRPHGETGGIAVGTMRTVQALVWAASLRSGAGQIDVNAAAPTLCFRPA